MTSGHGTEEVSLAPKKKYSESFSVNQSWKWQRQAVVPRWQQWVCKMHFSFLVAWLGSNYWCTYSWANCSKPTRRRGAGWCWLWWSKNGWSSTETGRWCRTPQTFIWWENALWNSQEQLWKDQGRVPQVSSDHFFQIIIILSYDAFLLPESPFDPLLFPVVCKKGLPFFLGLFCQISD